MDLKVAGTKGRKVGIGEEIGARLGAVVDVGTIGVGVEVAAGVEVRVGVLIGSLIVAGAALEEGVSFGVGTGEQAANATTSRLQSAERISFDISFMGPPGQDRCGFVQHCGAPSSPQVPHRVTAQLP